MCQLVHSDRSALSECVGDKRLEVAKEEITLFSNHPDKTEFQRNQIGQHFTYPAPKIGRFP